MNNNTLKKIIFCLILAGIVDSVYLFTSHFKNYTDISYQSFCAISKSINCDTVSQSYWSIFLGLPLSLWGILVYSFLLILFFSLFFNFSNNLRGWYLVFIVSVILSLNSIFLAVVSAYIIKSYCMMCILIYAVNFLLLYASYKAVANSSDPSLLKGLTADLFFIKNSLFLRYCICFLCICLVLIYLLLPKYWVMSPVQISEDVPHGVEKVTLNPWIGAEIPILTIYEYTDYMCFQCRKMHNYLRKLVAANPKKIRLVHINYPMDNAFNNIVAPESFHEGAGKLALLSEFASDRDEFWKINDVLFEVARLRGEINSEKISELTGLSKNDIAVALNHEYFEKRLNIDILTGMKKMITATPSYEINDVVYEGTIPPEVFKHAGIE